MVTNQALGRIELEMFNKVDYLETVMSYVFTCPSVIYTHHYSNNKQTNTKLSL